MKNTVPHPDHADPVRPGSRGLDHCRRVSFQLACVRLGSLRFNRFFTGGHAGQPGFGVKVWAYRNIGFYAHWSGVCEEDDEAKNVGMYVFDIAGEQSKNRWQR